MKKIIFGTVFCLLSFASLGAEIVSVKLPRPGKFIVTISSPSDCINHDFLLAWKTENFTYTNNSELLEIDAEVYLVTDRNGQVMHTMNCNWGAKSKAVGFFESQEENTTIIISGNKNLAALFKDVSVKVEEINSTTQVN